jgi:ribosomal protein S18 acetylase RimI-like enzyme
LASQLLRLAPPVGDQLSRVIADFDCLGEAHVGDPVAENVCGFLTDGRYRSGLDHDVSATYLLTDPDAEPPLLGYATLTFDSVRLTDTEKQRMGEIEFPDFGAVRIQMIGVDHRHQCSGHGSYLLHNVAGLARKLSRDVAVRFLIADANVRMVGWYEGAGFVRNQAEKMTKRLNPERSVSMRLDLIATLPSEATKKPAASSVETTG